MCSVLTIVSVLLAAISVAVFRLLWILPCFRTQPPASPKSSAKVVIVLGSGGHTAEMLRLLESLDFRKYIYRVYVVSSGDALSEGKARAFELQKYGKENKVVCNDFY